MKQLGISFDSVVLLFFNESSLGKSMAPSLMTAPRPRSLYTSRKAVYRQGWEVIFILVHEGTVNPLLTPLPLPPGGGGAYLFQTHLEGVGCLIGNGGLFNLEKTMLSVLHKDLLYKLENLKYKKLGDHAAEDHNEIRTSSW